MHSYWQGYPKAKGKEEKKIKNIGSGKWTKLGKQKNSKLFLVTQKQELLKKLVFLQWNRKKKQKTVTQKQKPSNFFISWTKPSRNAKLTIEPNARDIFDVNFPELFSNIRPS